MKILLKTGILFFVLFFVRHAKDLKAQQTPELLGWHLGTQAYSFRLFTLEEALNKADSIGIKYIEGFPGQKIGGGIDGSLDYHMPPGKRDSRVAVIKEKRDHHAFLWSNYPG